MSIFNVICHYVMKLMLNNPLEHYILWQLFSYIKTIMITKGPTHSLVDPLVAKNMLHHKTCEKYLKANTVLSFYIIVMESLYIIVRN